MGKTIVSCSFARYLTREFPQGHLLLLSTDPAQLVISILRDLFLSIKGLSMTKLTRRQQPLTLSK